MTGMAAALRRPLWIPSEERTAQSNLTAFMRAITQATGRDFSHYHQLYDWSIAEPAQFWEAIWRWSKVIYSVPYDKVQVGTAMPGTKWFVGAKLNFAENLLRYRDDHTAIIHWRENRPPVRLTYVELHAQVAACAEGLRKLGVGVGDRVAAYVPNIPEAVIGMLATTSLGAVWSSCSPDFGLQGVVDRFGQIGPKVLLVTDGYIYQGRPYDLLERVNALEEKVPSIEKVVIIEQTPMLDHPAVNKSMSWAELLDKPAEVIPFAQLPFDHPVYIMYSSGTTGVPKCIVHGAGGTLLQHYKELSLHTDLKREDVISYYTTTGWMMWNWLVSSLAVGATVFLFDGSPSHPNIEILWQAVGHEKISIFGTSPKYLTACQHAGLEPKQQFDLSSLKAILSTGSPLAAENFAWVYQAVKEDVQLSSISGGTDIISCFMLGNPLLPVYSEEIQCRGLGMKVEAWDDQGRPVIEQTGELVCAASFPSMPVSFWNDPDGSKYRSAYFDVYPGVWRHGDYIKITSEGGVIVYGRSDATLNPGGVRIGTAEIYNPVEALDEVIDSLVIGQRWKNDVRVVLFVVLRNGLTLTEELRQCIRDTVKKHNTPRHVPSVILQIAEVPRTLNGKKVEIAVTRVIHGEEVTNRDSLSNPQSLKQFESLPELR